MDTFDAILDAMNAALGETGQAPLEREELRPLIGMPVQRQLNLLRGMSGPVVDAITDRYYERFMEHVDRGLPLYPGVKETLLSLSQRAIATMTTRRRAGAVRMLEVTGLAPCFQAIVGGDEVSRPKPYPDLPLFAARALGRSPHDCAVVGDAPVDILAGRAARTLTIAATYGYGDSRALQQAKPHAMMHRFSELPRVLEELEGRGGS